MCSCVKSDLVLAHNDHRFKARNLSESGKDQTCSYGHMCTYMYICIYMYIGAGQYTD